MSAELAVTWFVLVLTGAFFVAPFKLTFSKLTWLDELLRRLCWVVGLFLLSLDTAIIATIAEGASLGVTNELFLFLWLTHKAAWLMMFYTVLKYTLDMLDLWGDKKSERRFGK